MTFKKPSRYVNTVFLHCSASDNPAHDDVSVMRDWHVNGNGWSDVGYHYFIQKSGNIQVGRDIEKIPAAQSGHNEGSIAICCHGLEESQFTEEQFDSLRAMCDEINAAYGNSLWFRGHCEVAVKSCPVYDYKSVLELDSGGYRGTGTDTVPHPQPPTIQITDSGYWVRIAQEELNTEGYGLVIDGLFGHETDAAVRDFQKLSGLTVDGIVGPNTWAVLYDE